eukprot:233463_1
MESSSSAQSKALDSSFIGFNDPSFSDKTIRFVETEFSLVKFGIQSSKRKSSKELGGSASKRQKTSAKTESLSQAEEKNESSNSETVCSNPAGVGGLDPVCETSAEIHVSKLLLSSRSGYFKLLFSSKFAESRQKVIDIVVPPGERILCEELIRYIYAGCPKTFPTISTASDLVKMLMIADRFDVPFAIRTACEMLAGIELSVNACQSLCSLPESVTLTSHFASLHRHVVAVLSKKFQKIGNVLKSDELREEFMGLDAKTASLVLKHPELEAQSENNIWCLLDRWYTHSPGRDISPLIGSIRFREMTSCYLVDVVTWSALYKENADIRKDVDDAIHFLALPLWRRKNSEKGQPPPLPSRSSSTPVSFDWSVPRARVTGLKPGDHICSAPVWVSGYAFYLDIYRPEENSEEKRSDDDIVDIILRIDRDTSRLRRAFRVRVHYVLRAFSARTRKWTAVSDPAARDIFPPGWGVDFRKAELTEDWEMFCDEKLSLKVEICVPTDAEDNRFDNIINV